MSRNLLILSAAFLFGSICSKVSAQSPTAPAKQFTIFVKGDAELISSETEGAIAVGGNLTTNQYGVNFAQQSHVFWSGTASVSLAVRGGVKLKNGSLQVLNGHYVKIGNCTPNDPSATNLKVWYRDLNNAATTISISAANQNYGSSPNISLSAHATDWTPEVSASNNPVCENVFGTGANQIDIDGAFTQMSTRSGQLKDLADNLPIRDQNGNIMQNAAMGPYTDPSVIGNNPKIIVNPNKVNVLTVSAAVWEKIKNSNVEGFPGDLQYGTTTYTGPFALIVNIIKFPEFVASKGSNKIDFPSFGGMGDGKASYVLYNFPDATDKITLGGNAQIVGTIFAPQADIVKANSGNINGQIIGKSFSHTGDELHFWPFLPSIPEPVVKKITLSANSLCENNAPYLNYTATPNYDAAGQTAKIEWLNGNGDVVKTDNGQPLNGKILFPGATVDGTGVGNNWPGWTYSNGTYTAVSDLNSTIKNEGAKIRVTVSPTETIDIAYPATTSTCRVSPPPTTPLPVKLASFSAKNENCEASLKWTVSESVNFSHFEVERSTDARSFITLSDVRYNESVKEYGYYDRPFTTEMTPSKNYYYRLKQVDNDDTFEYSAIRSVDAGSCDARLSVDFYPNPTQDFVNIKSFSKLQNVRILNVSGNEVFQSVAKDATEMKVDIQSLAKGLYIVSVTNAEGVHTSKIVKK